MNRKILALILALVAVAVAVVLVVTLNDDAPDGNTQGGNTPSEGINDNAPIMPGVEDSIFDDDVAQTLEPVGTGAPDETEETQETTLATEVVNTTPDGSANPDAGLQDPDVDIPVDTRPTQTEPAVTEPQQTEPRQTEPQQTEATEPQQTEPAETEPFQVPEGEIDYETFVALDPAHQREYMESFESMDAFFEWYNAAKEAYELEHPPIDVGDGVIDLEDLLG